VTNEVDAKTIRGERLSSGQRLGPYEILGPLGSGGMGEVYRAKDTRLRRHVALKVIHPNLVKPEYVERFAREARAAASLSHPNILAVFDVSIDGPIPYVVSELLDGESLRNRLDHGPLPYRKALEYGRQVAQALAAAHERGVHHRDVKPGNVFLTSDGQVKLLDFGLAKLRSQDLSDDSTDVTAPDPSRPGRVIGTVGYMAPEQVLGEEADGRTDIFGLGAVLYEMLTGRRAFLRPTPAETMHAVVAEEPEDLHSLVPGLPAAAGIAVRRCLEKKPEERFQSARDLAFHLHQLAQATTETHTTPSPLPATRRLLVGETLGVVALAALSLWLLFSPRPRAEFEQLTFHKGRIGGARFADEGIVFSQSTGLTAPEIALRLADSPEPRLLGYTDANVLATRPGELALALRPRFIRGERFLGTLAVAPLGGGAPREVLEQVEDADYDPSGSFAVVRSKSLGEIGSRLESPPGRVLYETEGSLHCPRFSPDGTLLAFLDDPASLGTRGQVVVVDREGDVVLRTRDWERARGLAWSSDGDEVWFTAAEGRTNRILRGVDLRGRERVIHQVPGSLTLWDVALDGRVLLSREEERFSLVGVPPGATAERELSWFDNAGLSSLSADGRFVLFGDRFGLYLRDTDGSAPTRLRSAVGYADDLSPDGRLVITTSLSADQLSLVPTGPGEPQPLEIEGLHAFSGSLWFPDGERILVSARGAPGSALRSYVVTLPGGTPRPVTDEGTWGLSISPDGEQLAAITPGAGISIWSVNGGASREVPGTRAGDRPVSWSSDGRSLWVFRRGEVPAQVDLLDIATGSRRLWKKLVPPDPAGVFSIDQVRVTPSGDSYFYSYRRTLSELYVAHGLR
jgi:serine/threonine protein kinase/WD40 repeat protein